MRKSTPQRTSNRRQSPQVTFGLLASAIVLILGFLTYQFLKWEVYWIWLLVVNVVAFIFFRLDKRQAQQSGAVRVPEVVLLALLVVGGVVGGVAGMLMPPRHKTAKPLFWATLIGATAFHAYMLYRWLFVG